MLNSIVVVGTINRLMLHLNLPRNYFLKNTLQFGPNLDQDFLRPCVSLSNLRIYFENFSMIVHNK